MLGILWLFLGKCTTPQYTVWNVSNHLWIRWKSHETMLGDITWGEKISLQSASINLWCSSSSKSTLISECFNIIYDSKQTLFVALMKFEWNEPEKLFVCSLCDKTSSSAALVEYRRKKSLRRLINQIFWFVIQFVGLLVKTFKQSWEKFITWKWVLNDFPTMRKTALHSSVNCWIPD